MGKIDKLIRKYGETDPDKVWDSIETDDELFICNLAYVTGYIRSVRMHRTSYDTKYAALHDRRIFVHSVNEAKVVNYKHETTNEDVIIKERLIMQCFIQYEHCFELLKYLCDNKYPENDGILFEINTPFETYTNMLDSKHLIEDKYKLSIALIKAKKVYETKWEIIKTLTVDNGSFDYCDELNTKNGKVRKITKIVHDDLDLPDDYMRVVMTTTKWDSKINFAKELKQFYYTLEES